MVFWGFSEGVFGFLEMFRRFSMVFQKFLVHFRGVWEALKGFLACFGGVSEIFEVFLGVSRMFKDFSRVF